MKSEVMTVAQSSSLPLLHFAAWLDSGRSAVPSMLSGSAPRSHVLLAQHLNLLQDVSGDARRLDELQRLRQRACARPDLPTSAAFAKLIFGAKMPEPKPTNVPPRDPSIGKHGKPKRPSGKHKPRSGKRTERPVEVVKEDKANVSRSGRSVKTPSKFKEPERPALQHHMRLQLSPNARKRTGASDEPARPTPKSARSSARRPRSAAGEDDPGEEEPAASASYGYEAACISIGDDFQAEVLPAPVPSTCFERGDALVWSATRMGAAGVGGVALDAYLTEALTLVGGPPQQPPTQTSAQQEFPIELALAALHACSGDVAAALAQLRGSSGGSGETWSKVEERHLHAALARSKTVDLRSVRDYVKTKDLKAVVRYFYVVDGERKKEHRDKEREKYDLEREKYDLELRLRARSALSQGSANANAAQGGGGGGGGGGSTRASSPCSAQGSAIENETRAPLEEDDSSAHEKGEQEELEDD